MLADAGDGTFATADVSEGIYLTKTRNKIRLAAIADLIFTLGMVVILMFVIALNNDSEWTLLLLFQIPHVFSWLVAAVAAGKNTMTAIRVFRYYMLTTAVLDLLSFVIRLIRLVECFDAESNSCLSTGIQDILFLLFVLILIVLDVLQLIFSYLLETELKRKFQVIMGSYEVSGDSTYAADPRPPLDTASAPFQPHHSSSYGYVPPPPWSPPRPTGSGVARRHTPPVETAPAVRGNKLQF